MTTAELAAHRRRLELERDAVRRAGEQSRRITETLARSFRVRAEVIAELRETRRSR